MQPAFDTLKPEGESGFVHAGPVGAGHFAKMVHNGIEYGMMQAYGEGYEVLKACELIEDLPGVIKSWTGGHRDPVLAARSTGSRARSRIPIWISSAARPRTPARAGGLSRPRSTTPSPCR